MVEGVDSEDQQAPGEEPVALNGMPVEAADQGTPTFRFVSRLSAFRIVSHAFRMRSRLIRPRGYHEQRPTGHTPTGASDALVGTLMEPHRVSVSKMIL